MSSLPPQPDPATRNLPPIASMAASTAPRTTESGPVRRGRIWAAAMAAGLVAALASWFAGEATLGAFVPPREAMIPGPFRGTTPVMLAAQLAADTKNTALNYGLCGAFLGLSLGLGGALAAAAPRRVPLGAACGLVLGGGGAAGLAAALTPVFHRYYDPAAPSMLLPLLILGGIWTATGAACGVSFGLGLGGREIVARTLWGGALGAILATFAFELIYAIAFPLGGSEQVILPTGPSRLIASLCIALFTAGGVAWSSQTPRGRVALAPAP